MLFSFLLFLFLFFFFLFFFSFPFVVASHVSNTGTGIQWTPPNWKPLILEFRCILLLLLLLFSSFFKLLSPPGFEPQSIWGGGHHRTEKSKPRGTPPPKIRFPLKWPQMGAMAHSTLKRKNVMNHGELRQLTLSCVINLIEVKILEHSLNDYVRTLKRRS